MLLFSFTMADTFDIFEDLSPDMRFQDEKHWAVKNYG